MGPKKKDKDEEIWGIFPWAIAEDLLECVGPCVELGLKSLMHCNPLNNCTKKRQQAKIHTKSTFNALPTTFYYQLRIYFRSNLYQDLLQEF